MVEPTVKTKCFIGIEAEGPHRGTPVLFIPGKMTIKQIQRAIKQERLI